MEIFQRQMAFMRMLWRGRKYVAMGMVALKNKANSPAARKENM
jgi:hypothetical protein